MLITKGIRAYYNDSDRHVCAWLRELIKGGLITPGEVDERPIQDVQPADLVGFHRVHMFAGIAGWDHALNLAGWGAASAWTGSCPCQGYSAAGKQQGAADARNLWPSWFRLIRECRPVRIFGEQVENAVGHGWLDAVSTDLEAEDYAIGAAVLGAHSVGAPHIRQRLWFVAESENNRREDRPTLEPREYRQGVASTESGLESGAVSSLSGELAESQRAERWARPLNRADDLHEVESRPKGASGSGERRESGELAADRNQALGTQEASAWANADWLQCRDGKYRPVEPGTFPLAHGVSGRVGRLRGYGNAINVYTAAAFIRAYLEIRP